MAKSTSAEQAVTAAATAATSGTYYAVVRPLDGSGGNYNFSVAAAPGTATADPLDGTGGPIANGAGVTGNINGQLDVYSFKATSGGTIEASAGGSFYGQGLKLSVDLYTPAGKPLAKASSVNAEQAVTLSATAATTGTYYAVVRSADGSGGNYHFSVAAVPGTAAVDPLDNVGGPIADGVGVTGDLNGQLDVFSFAATAGGTIAAAAGGGFYRQALNLAVDIYDPAGKLVASAPSAAAERATVATVTADSTGTYCAVVRSLDGSGGNYNLSIATTPGTAKVDALDGVGGPIASGVGVTGDLNGQLDRYSFAATAGGTIEASAGGGFYGQGLKLELDLYTPAGKLLAAASSAAAEQAVTLSATPAMSGTYYAVIRSADESVGNYHFSVAAAPGTATLDPLDNVGGPINSGVGVTGDLNGQLDVYSFAAAAGGTIEASAGRGFYGQGLKLAVDLFDPARQAVDDGQDGRRRAGRDGLGHGGNRRDLLRRRPVAGRQRRELQLHGRGPRRGRARRPARRRRRADRQRDRRDRQHQR